jgi:HK97 gp10 family phage protein
MADEIKFDITGLKETKELLEQLPKRAFTKALRRGLTKGATPIRKDMKRRARKATGLLRRSIKTRVKTFSNGNVIALTGPDRNVMETRTNSKGKEVRHRPAFIAHLIEDGHGGPHPAPAFPFKQPAYEQTKDQAANIAKETIKEVIQQEAAKLGKKE